MKKLIYAFVFAVLLFGISSNIKPAMAEESPGRYYKVELIKQENDSIRVNNYNIIVSLGSVPLMEEKNALLAELYSLSDEKLLQSYFAMPEEGNYFLSIPYKANGKEIKILSSDSGEELLKINVQVFAKVCGDKECQGHESYENCSEDCPSGSADDYCDHIEDGVCDFDCQNIKDADTDCTGENPATVQAELKKRLGLNDDGKKIGAEEENGFKSIPKTKNLAMFIGLIVAAVLVIIFLFVRRKNNLNQG